MVELTGLSRAIIRRHLSQPGFTLGYILAIEYDSARKAVADVYSQCLFYLHLTLRHTQTFV